MAVELTPEEREEADRIDAHRRKRAVAMGWPDYETVRYFDMDGDPLTLGEYTVLLARRHTDAVSEDFYGRVASTVVGELWVSTVWLGLDHGYDRPEGYDGPVHNFETMVFVNDSETGERAQLDDDDEDRWTMDRYPDKGSALLGHQRAVNFARQHPRAREFALAMRERFGD